MRYRIIPLMVTCFILLTSLSECNQGDFSIFESKRQSPLSAELDGVLFSSNEQTIYSWAYTESYLRKKESEFLFGFDRDVSSEDNVASIHLDIIEDSPFELNTKYDLKNTDRAGYGMVEITIDDIAYHFLSTEGYVVFTKCKSSSGGTTHTVSGYFEFTAVDAENDGKTIKVTNGKFEDLYAE